MGSFTSDSQSLHSDGSAAWHTRRVQHVRSDLHGQGVDVRRLIVDVRHTWARRGGAYRGIGVGTVVVDLHLVLILLILLLGVVAVARAIVEFLPQAEALGVLLFALHLLDDLLTVLLVLLVVRHFIEAASFGE